MSRQLSHNRHYTKLKLRIVSNVVCNFPPGAMIGGWARRCRMFEHNDVLHDQVCEVMYDARDEYCGCAVTARRVLKAIDAYLTAQPQESEEQAENSPASPVQQRQGEMPLASPCYWCTNCGSDECAKCGPDERWRHYRP
jgi:hypothetical protein